MRRSFCRWKQLHSCNPSLLKVCGEISRSWPWLLVFWYSKILSHSCVFSAFHSNIKSVWTTAMRYVLFSPCPFLLPRISAGKILGSVHSLPFDQMTSVSSFLLYFKSEHFTIFNMSRKKFNGSERFKTVEISNMTTLFFLLINTAGINSQTIFKKVWGESSLSRFFERAIQFIKGAYKWKKNRQ